MKPGDVQVQIRHRCRHCGENGYVENEDWRAINEAEKALREKKGRPLTNNEFDQIMEDLGHNPDPKYWPPDEFECEYCQGTIIEQRWISLEELKEMMNNAHQEIPGNKASV